MSFHKYFVRDMPTTLLGKRNSSSSDKVSFPKMKPDRGGRDSAGSAGMETSDHKHVDLDNISHSPSYAFRLLANLNELRNNKNNNLCDVEIVAGKGKRKICSNF